MAQADNTKANKLAYLHVRIVQRVLRNLLQFIVTQNNQQWSLADYIHANGEQILRTQFGQRHFQILFPRNSEVTIDALPLYLIEHLITDVPECVLLPRDINDAIRALIQSRRESNTPIVTGVNDIFFDDQLENVQQLLTTICRFMNNNSLQLEIQRDIESLRLTSFGNDETVLDEFSAHYEKEKSSRKAVTSIMNEQRTFHQILANVAILHEGNEPDQPAEQRTELLRPNEVFPVQVTDAVLELVAQTDNTTLNARISRDFVNIINNQEDSSEPNALWERRDEIRAHVTSTFSYYGDLYAKQGCVQICVKPRSVKHLFELFEDCVSGEITKKLKPVEELIRDINNFETYKQEAVLYQDHYDSVMNEIVSQLRHQFEERGFPLPNENTVPRVELSQKGTILVRVPCPSRDESDQFENTFKSGYMNDLVKPLEDILNAAYGEKYVSLKAQVDYGKHATSEIPDEQTTCEPVLITARCDPKSDTYKLKDVHVEMTDDSSNPSITGFAVVPPNYIIGADDINNCIKLFDIETKARIGTPIQTCNKPTCKPDCHICKPWDVVLIDEQNKHVVVSVPESGKLIFVTITENQLVQYNELVGHDHCRGLAFADNQLYVGYEHPKRQIKVIGLDGKEIRVFSDVRFHSPWFLAFDEQSKSVYISEVLKSKVYQLNEGGNIVKTINVKQIIKTQRGIAIKDQSTLYIVGRGWKKEEDFAYEVDIISGKSTAILRVEDSFPKCVRRYRDSMFLSVYGLDRILQFEI